MGTDGEDGSDLGICCSGGGIRSAAFNLGALQSLDEEGLLTRADHLAAVSGGSYIASAWAVAARHSTPELLADQRAFAPGSPEESWVRAHSSYLTDGVVDTLRLVAVALVGFLANVVLFTALLWTVARPLGWLYAAWQPGLRVPATCTPGLSEAEAAAAGCFDGATLTGLGPWALAAGVLVGAALVLALAVRMFMPEWTWRLRLCRAAVGLLLAGVAVALVMLAIPAGVVAVRDLLGGEPAAVPVAGAEGPASAQDKSTSNLGFIAGIGAAATLLGLVTQVRRALGQPLVVRTTAWIGRQSRGLRRVLNTLLGALIAPVALAAAALLIVDAGTTAASPDGREGVWWAAALGLSVVMLAFGDVTGWSLHPFYKRRLSRTFAVKREPDPVTHEPMATEVPFDEVLDLTQFTAAAYREHGTGPFPELLVCAAVNVSDPGAVPPGRNGLSFVFGPRRIGCPDRLAVTRRASMWRRLTHPAETEAGSERLSSLEAGTGDYVDRLGERRRRDVTLPAAVAISGAAVAPAMGKMTRPSLRFLLALTNVRLGVWLPNPIPPPARPGRLGRLTRWLAVRPRQWHLLFEVLGRHRVRSPYLFVTDGGHVENLGLVELLRRRCRVVVCLDAAGGSTDRFSTLGEALAIARADLGVEVDIEPTELRPSSRGINACDHVVGTIRYPGGRPGTLIYGKAVVTAEAPWSVRAYGEKDRLFPVHPTGDQAYSGEMFDAYQALGRHVGARCADAALARENAGNGAAVADERSRPPAAAATSSRP